MEAFRMSAYRDSRSCVYLMVFTLAIKEAQLSHLHLMCNHNSRPGGDLAVEWLEKHSLWPETVRYVHMGVGHEFFSM